MPTYFDAGGQLPFDTGDTDDLSNTCHGGTMQCTLNVPDASTGWHASFGPIGDVHEQGPMDKCINEYAMALGPFALATISFRMIRDGVRSFALLLSLSMAVEIVMSSCDRMLIACSCICT